jgi:hypothetical protein
MYWFQTLLVGEQAFFNAPAVNLEQVSEVVLLWKTATYRLEYG